MKTNRSSVRVVAYVGVLTSILAITAFAQYPEPVWTGTGCTLTPDEGSVGKYQLGTGSQFSFATGTYGTIEGRINLASQNTDTTPVRYSCLQVCFTDPDALNARIRVYVYRVGTPDGSCCTSALIASFDSNGYPASTSCQSQTVGINAAYQVFDFIDYAYYVYVQVYRSSTNYVPSFYTARLMPCGAFDAPVPEMNGGLDPTDEEIGQLTNANSSIPMGTTSAIRSLVPNPTQAGAAIHYDLRASGPVSLEIYDVAGRLVRSLADEDQQAGAHVVNWNGLNNENQKCVPGIYFVRLRPAFGGGDDRKLILSR